MLAQTHTFTTADSVRIIIWSFVLITILVLAFAAVARVKRRLRDDVDDNPSAAAGFSLSDLRQMHRDGIITDEELDKAKSKIVHAARRASDRDSSIPPQAGLQ